MSRLKFLLPPTIHDLGHDEQTCFVASTMAPSSSDAMPGFPLLWCKIFVSDMVSLAVEHERRDLQLDCLRCTISPATSSFWAFSLMNLE